MNKAIIMIREHYSHISKEMLLLIVLNLAAGWALRFIEVDSIIKIGAGVILVWKNLAFYREYSLIPSTMTTNSNRFSWKYYQGLPLNKTELIVGLSVCELISYLPILSFLLAFYPYILILIGIEKKDFVISNYLTILYYSPVILIITSTILKNVILFPRQSFSSVNRRIQFLCALRDIIGYIALAIVVVGCLLYLQENTPFKAVEHFLLLLKSILDIFGTPWTFALLLSVAFLNYLWTIRVWRDEKIGHFKNNWKAQRDVPILFSCIYCAIFTFNQIDYGLYAGNRINKAVDNNNYDQIKELIAEGEDINRPNKFGFNPLLVAAHKGNRWMYNFLKSKGAKADQRISLEKDPLHGMNLFLMAIVGGNDQIIEELINNGASTSETNPVTGDSVLHVAASRCHLAAMNLLIKRGANVHATNNKNETPMHSALKKRCLPAMALLIDNGADPKIKNKKQELIVLNLMAKYSSEKPMVEYIRAKARTPASQTK